MSKGNPDSRASNRWIRHELVTDLNDKSGQNPPHVRPTCGAPKFVLGFVVWATRPDHVHLLISEPPKATPSVVLKALKQRVSRDLRKKRRRASSAQLSLPFMGAGTAPLRFWQPRFYDFNVYSKHKKREKLKYMHGNPVVRGLVKNPGAWMWSSFLFYEKGEAGLVPIDPVD